MVSGNDAEHGLFDVELVGRLFVGRKFFEVGFEQIEERLVVVGVDAVVEKEV